MALRLFRKKEKQEHKILRRSLAPAIIFSPNIIVPRPSARNPAAGACLTP
jgi:hypothetical protein